MLLFAGGGVLAVQCDDTRQNAGNLLRRVELAGLLAGTGGKLADQVFIGVAQGVLVGGKLRQALGDGLDDGAELGIARLVALAQFFRIQVDLGEQPAEGTGEGFVLDVVEALLQGMQQLPVLGAGQLRDAAPEVFRLDHVMGLAAHLLFKFFRVVRVLRVPHRQQGAAVAGGQLRVVRPEFFLRCCFVVVREVAQEQEGQHVIAEIVRIHRAAQLVGDAPEDIAQLFLVLFGHARVIFFVGSDVRSRAGSGSGRPLIPAPRPAREKAAASSPFCGF